MKIKYYYEDGDYGVDFHTNTPRNDSVTIEVSEEELHELVTVPMCEIRERARDALNSN